MSVPTHVIQDRPPWVNAALQDVYNRLNYHTNNYTPGGGAGAYVAPPSPNLERAFQEASNLNVPQGPFQFNERAASHASRPFPEQFQNYLNPYQNQVLRNVEKDATKNFKDSILPQLENTFVQRGQHGSRRHADLSAKAAREVQEAISDQQAKLLSNYYTQAAELYHMDRMRDLLGAKQAMEGQRENQGQTLAAMAARTDLGNLQRELAQQPLNFTLGQEREQREHPTRMLAVLANLLNSNAVPQMQSTYNMAPPAPQPGVGGNLANIAQTLLGMRMMGGRQ